MRKLPKELTRYFWDVDISSLSKKEHADFIAERLLEFGDLNTIRWLFKEFPKKELIKTLTKSRKLSKKSAYFWAALLNIPKKEVLCLSKHYQKKHKAIWRH